MMATLEGIQVANLQVSTSGSTDLQGSDDDMCGDPDLDNLFDEIDKLDKTSLPPELQSLDLPKLKKTYASADSVCLQITGKTGAGKSALTNGILGLKVKDEGAAREGSGTKGCTKQATKYERKKGKLVVTVWDNPGLLDGTKNQEEYLEQMRSGFRKRDLTVHCIRMSDIRFVDGDDNPDVLVMKKLTRTFGMEFWYNTIIVLTYANLLEAFHVEWEDRSEKEKIEAFKQKLQEWEQQIRKVLIRDVGVPEESVRAIKVIPAGHYKKPHLPGCPYWLSALWFHCLGTISTTEKQAALVKMNIERFKIESNVGEEDFKKPPELQPIVLNKNTVSVISHPSKVLIEVAFGAVVGGTLGLFSGLPATAAVPMGAVIGALLVALM